MVSPGTPFAGFTTIAIPSRATVALDSSAASGGSVTRSAIPISAVPDNADWMPNAEPPPCTVMDTSGRLVMNCSASFSANG